MILDELSEFADATAIPTATGTAIVGDVVDLGSDPNDVEGVYLVIQVDTAVTSAGSATVAFQLVSDAQAALAVDGSATVHYASAALAKATLVGGYRVCAVALPKGPYERYLGVIATVGTAALTAGKVNAFLTNNVNTFKAFDAPFQL